MENNTENEATLPEIYFDHRSGSYWVNNDRDNWMKFSESSVKRLLKSHGISAECGKMENLSPLDETILKIQTTKDINYAASLAGYKKGIHHINESRILVIDSPKIILPKEGEFPLLTAIIFHACFDGLIILV